uniref:non-ribosomal peptide synthetase n=1 Tax=Candidatus Chloroploca sp. Khr17 TaxID=2496869 RepID=UPI0013ED45BA
LVLAAPETRANPLALVAWLQEEAVSLATLPPSLLAVLTPSDFPQLTSVISAGEACSWEVAERWSAGRRFVNAYGPTEATIGATCHHVAERVAGATTVPIGRPFSNVQIYLLDSYGQQVPVGVAGELHIGGAGVARGYLNRPELTGEKFIRDPFSPLAAARLYKTGDLARYLPDGTLEYLGRLDHQVKLRGFRIELGEIEAVLRQHPTMQEAIVIMREDTPGEKRLVAYLVAASGAEAVPLAADLRAFLSERLPEYMIPAVFVSLDALPLNPNGKVDRKALPAPSMPGQSATQYVAPQTELEQQLAAIWQAVLQLERVGIHDNFFELGGHSLLATQVIAHIRKVFQIALPMQTIFAEPTVAGLSCHIALTQRITAGAPVQASADSIELEEGVL